MQYKDHHTLYPFLGKLNVFSSDFLVFSLPIFLDQPAEQFTIAHESVFFLQAGALPEILPIGKISLHYCLSGSLLSGVIVPPQSIFSLLPPSKTTHTLTKPSLFPLLSSGHMGFSLLHVVIDVN